MTLVLFTLLSGDARPIGIGLLGIGALVALAHPRVGPSVGACGVALAAASAVPLHTAVYAALGFAFAVWLVFVRRSPRARWISTGLLSVVLVLTSVTNPRTAVVMFELPLLPLQNRYGQVQRQISREFGVRLISRRVLAGAVTLPGHTTDGLHLSPAGHRWLAGEVARWL